MNENQVICAHSRVVLRHRDYPDGSRSDWWECESGCCQRFHPEINRQELRDGFAMAALTGILAADAKTAPEVTDKNVDYVIAREAYASADAMLIERDIQRPPPPTQ